MSNNTPDYKEDLVFEPDYSIYETARKLRKLAYERDIKIVKDKENYLYFNNFCLAIETRAIRTLESFDFIIKPKTNKHLVDIVEVLTRS